MAYTRTFAVTERIATMLEDATWPAHPVTTETPHVSIGMDEAYSGEAIIVRLRTDEDAATVEWMKMSTHGRDERFIVDVYVESTVAGATWRQMWDRLAELADVVLAKFVDDSQFIHPGGRDDTAPGYLGVWSGDANVAEHDQWGTDEGWSGRCRIAVRVAALI